MAYDVGLADRIRTVLAACRCGFDERKMFGGVCFMVNGHMSCGVIKTDLVLRLAPEEAEAALRQPHVRPMDFTGKPMKSMVYVDARGTDSDDALTRWIERAVDYARARPPKEADAKKRRKVPS